MDNYPAGVTNRTIATSIIPEWFTETIRVDLMDAPLDQIQDAFESYISREPDYGY